MNEFRVMFQYVDDKGHPRFEFTTILGVDMADAAATLMSMRSGDYGLHVVQVELSNGVSTGYTTADYAAAVENARLQREAHPGGG
jgi:hypothetical protein